MKLLEDESGLSVIVGTLLLIMIVVASASALAVMVSNAQKKEMEQQSLRAAVESENLKILSLALNPPDSNGNWTNVIVTVTNLNTEESKIVGLNINGINAANYTDKDGVSYNFHNQFPVPAAGSRQIFLNLSSNFVSPLNISQSDSVRIILFTSLTNNFERVFLPPVPIIKVSSQSDTGFGNVLVLDGSDSISHESTIINYQWQVNNTYSSTYNYSKSGQMLRIPFDFINVTNFQVNLTVTDSNGMQGSAQWISP